MGILDWIQSNRDVKALGSLATTVKRGDAVAFVGAGMSARVGYADWNALVDKLAAAAAGPEQRDMQKRETTDLTRDLSWMADSYRSKLAEGRYRDLLSEHFAPREPARDDRCIEALVRLPFRYILTTNYDQTLEQAWLAADRETPLRVVTWSDAVAVRDFMCSVAEPNATHRYLVYLHGRWNDPGSIVLSERDYVERYVSADGTTRKLFAIFAMRPVVFFGFSLEDPDVMAIFRQVNAIHGQARHHAVLPTNSSNETPKEREARRNRFEMKFGVRPVFYRTDPDSPDDPHHRLLDVLEMLADQIPVESETQAAPVQAPSPAPSLRHHSTPWRDDPEFERRRGAADPEDPQKGRFGGAAQRDGLSLSASVTTSPDDEDWFDIVLTVTGNPPSRLVGTVEFYVHDTFAKERYETKATNGEATLRLGGYGAFTVGALADDGRTPLELDLSTLGPRSFRIR